MMKDKTQRMLQTRGIGIGVLDFPGRGAINCALTSSLFRSAGLLSIFVLRWAQDVVSLSNHGFLILLHQRPFVIAQDMPFDETQDMPFDETQDMLGARNFIKVFLSNNLTAESRHWSAMWSN